MKTLLVYERATNKVVGTIVLAVRGVPEQVALQHWCQQQGVGPVGNYRADPLFNIVVIDTDTKLGG